MQIAGAFDKLVANQHYNPSFFHPILFVVSIFLVAMGLSLAQVGGGNNPIFKTIVASLQGVVGWLQIQADWQIASYFLALALIFTAAQLSCL